MSGANKIVLVARQKKDKERPGKKERRIRREGRVEITMSQR